MLILVETPLEVVTEQIVRPRFRLGEIRLPCQRKELDLV
jgi:hypothetical protein